ncbi:alpha/beta fold hydrolase [Luteolibacter arcticus]|uniref:Alpha/beta fold hydrolase n=1 Tax=Luteolibacter arcticus TaxID=1581411 RepID=A0ABT3GJD2_9BACT|nr:alpha/beta fold hydrolase [Luteolibacter arcticus]MCW1923617.1 alpha/beta fold hydrolase [Luteolibacter arcticus]
MKLQAIFAAAFALTSCVAPVSFHVVETKTPPGDYHVAPLDAALAELEAGKASADAMEASGHFLESARLAGDKALAGEPGAVALYNHAVGRLVERLEKAKALPWGRTITVGSGPTARTLRGKLEPGASNAHREYHVVDRYDFRGKYATIHATRPGVGAPLVVLADSSPDFRKTFDPPQVSMALTAVVRAEGSRGAVLELHDPLEEERISIAGRNPVLAANFSAPVSFVLAVTRPDKLGLIRLINPQKYSDTARLIRLQKYDKNRIPVLFVHGLQDTPATWAPMYHSIMQDPELRNRYQFWVFSYPSGYPYPYSASLLRKELDGVNRVFPDHKKMVIVGHSMGSMISRLMVTNAGDRIWRDIFAKGPDDMRITGASRELLRDSLLFEHRREINRAIFLSAPHKGSEIASNWIGRLGSRLVRMPTFLADARNAVASVITVDAASLQLDRAPNSIDTLSPENRFVKAVNKLPIAPGIPYHSVMGDRGKGGNKDRTRPMMSDGVVAFWSSHLDGSASEKVVPSHHSAHQHPDGIAEVKRILKLHLGQGR